MENSSPLKTLTRVALALLLMSPLIILVFNVEVWSWIPYEDLKPAFINTFLQSFLSASLALGFGFFGAMGLLAVQKNRIFTEILLVLPTFLPTLFVLLACLQIISPFPFGISGIVLVHTIIYSGVLAVMICRLFETKIGGFSELAQVEGASRLQFLRYGVIPYLYKDLLMVFGYVFAMAVSSFSIPIVVGGRGVSTLEILIYEKAIIESNLAQAVVLCLMQFFFLFVLSFVSTQKVYPASSTKNLDLLQMRFAHIPLVVISILIVGVNLFGIFKGFAEMQNLGNLYELIAHAFIGTSTVSLFVGIFIFFFLLLIAYGLPHKRFEKFLQSFVSPSTVLLGFSFMLIGSGTLSRQSDFETLLKISLAFSLLVLCGLYRLRWSSSLDNLKGQLDVAMILGARTWQTYVKIVLPQVLFEALLLAGVACFWASGEFALSQLLTGQPLTLALIASGLLGSYRFEAATLFIWMSMFVGVLSFLIFWSLSRVAHKKYLS